MGASVNFSLQFFGDIRGKCRNCLHAGFRRKHNPLILLVNCFWHAFCTIYSTIHEMNAKMMKSTFQKVLFVAAFLIPFQAHAVLISTSIGDYDVTTVEGNLSTLTPQLSQQVWWGSSALAQEFASLVGGSLGLNVINSDRGPYFLYTNTRTRVYRPSTDSVISPSLLLDDRYIRTHAIARAVPEPATLGLFALGLIGLGLARRKRA